MYSFAIVMWELFARKLPFDEFSRLYKFLPDYEDAIARYVFIRKKKNGSILANLFHFFFFFFHPHLI